MILNIDEFNAINQVYGSVFGNKLLSEVANRLQTVLRQVDTVSRYAGDSYFFILPELSNPEVSVLVAQRIQDSIIQPFTIDNHRIFVTASIGISVFVSEDAESDKLVKNAEAALNKARASGRNTYRIHNQLEHKLNPDDESLNQYFSSNTFLEKLVMLYQPYIDINQDKICTVHAMPYFNHPENGMMPFHQFIHSAEENGKMVEIGKWQLREAIQQFKSWKTAGYRIENIMMSATLSQLESDNSIQYAADMIDKAGVDKSKIILDIANINAKLNSEAFKETLQALKDADMKIAINIMSLGRLALHNILEFPINYLKIDELLVKGLILNLDNEAIIASLIAISNNADIRVIAEGVDFDNQKEKLKELGCSIMKGKQFGGAVPGNELFEVATLMQSENEKSN